MEINYWAILACTVIAMIIGFIWYTPIFGKTWMKLNGVDGNDKEKMKEGMKEMPRLMIIQFVLTFVQLWVLQYFVIIDKTVGNSGIVTGFLVWLGFVMPVLAGANMFTAESKSNQRTRFLIQAGCQLVYALVFGYILGAW